MMIERYTEGVNAFMASCRGNDELPTGEYRLLGENAGAMETMALRGGHAPARIIDGVSLVQSYGVRRSLRTIGPEAVNLLRYDDGG